MHAVTRLALDSGRNRATVRPALGRVVAGCTAHRSVARDPRVEIELTAQLIFPLGDRIAGRDNDLRRGRHQTGRDRDLKRFVRDQLGLGNLPKIIGRARRILLGRLLRFLLSRWCRLHQAAGPAAQTAEQQQTGHKIASDLFKRRIDRLRSKVCQCSPPEHFSATKNQALTGTQPIPAHGSTSVWPLLEGEKP